MNLYKYRGVIVDFYDGDSPTVNIDLGFRHWMMDQKLRLYGIDTPELRGADRERGLMVRDKVREWCPAGSEVIVQSHKDESGKFGRWLATLWPDGWEISLNQRLYLSDFAEIKTYDVRKDMALRREWRKE